ncbi:nicotinamidase [Haliangium ochraceum]|uniref:Nicotinamidase n=1 Tax=Haliangium ochraceum (strain DSM 14365 / JCM 11303 / SMP-2) TaxID=502025 RepID=D0LHW8_HALO1|nr:nicotinamidase [Haliangium ochraceum]ACY14797.1 conserved hypothetical protein [Haliangium ochraceum DSM 14365]
MNPVPAFFDPAHAADWGYRPDHQNLLEEAASWRAQHQVRPAASDERRISALLIDVQKDFSFPEGTLYVGGRSGRGAIEDNARLSAFLLRNASAITDITATFDTHHAHQIFFTSFWLDEDGKPPAPHSVVTSADLSAGRLRPNPALAAWVADGDADWLGKQALHYVEELERHGKYQLYLWPPHCILGSDGHALVGLVHEARMFHAYLRGSPATAEIKGEHALTENYSVFAPEVLTRHDHGVLGQRNSALLDRLLRSDAILVAGQAASHCVKSSIDDLLSEIQARDPALARKVYVLTDCMSSVAVPDGEGGFFADFTEHSEAAQARWAEAGMHLVQAEQPMSDWLAL